MATTRGARLPVGSTAWVAEERSSAMQIAQSEVDEFEFSARNEVEWLNEHMADIFSENQINVAEIFKTPGKLRGKTPRTARKANAGEHRTPLGDVFSAIPKGAPNPFAIPNLNQHPTSKLKIAEDKPIPPSPKPTNASKAVASPRPQVSRPAVAFVDSGYHGSQSQEAMVDIDVAEPTQEFAQDHTEINAPGSPEVVEPPSPTPQPTVDPTFHSTTGEQTMAAEVSSPAPAPSSPVQSPRPASPAQAVPEQSTTPKYSPAKQNAPVPTQSPVPETAMDIDEGGDAHADETRSPSDGSSPIRPLVRKSSMNFASLPAREPLTNKSLGPRMSRASHLDQARPSYFNRHTGGKSLGVLPQDTIEDEGEEDVDGNGDFTTQTNDMSTHIAAHNKTYTQRLQHQISMLGKSQPNDPRPSRSIHALAPSRQQDVLPTNPPQSQPAQVVHEAKPLPSPKKYEPSTPGAFPEEEDDDDDDQDDWIAPPAATTQQLPPSTSQRPVMIKSYTADVMEGVRGQDTVGGSDFALPTQRRADNVPASQEAPSGPERTTSAFGHSKSASVPVLPLASSVEEAEEMVSPKKTISVSKPPLPPVSETDRPATPKSPSRNFRESPLKQVKNKLSSILKSSKGLLASSAAISAEGKAALMSPSSTRLGLLHAGPSSVESFSSHFAFKSTEQQLYPDLSQHQAPGAQTLNGSTSPARNNGRRTRASTEREKREQKQKEKEDKEAHRLAEQQEKQEKALEKVREKEREKARVFSQEQERIAAMERQIVAQKEREKAAQPPLPPPTDALRPTRTSPRKAKPQSEADDRRTPAPSTTVAAADDDDHHHDDEVMIDAPVIKPPQSAPRTVGPTPASRIRELKRPVKPTTQAATKAKQAPTVIRVNMGSQHPGFHPSNSILSATLQDTLGSQQQQQQQQSQHTLNSKASKASLQTKPSIQSLKSSVSSTGKPKALELAAKRKEQEEREAQRKRDAKLEMERKRAAAQEEERKREQERQAEAEKQKEKERDQAAQPAEAKNNASRQAAIEKAKNTRAPPPPVRTYPNGPPDYHGASNAPFQRNDGGASRPQSRLGNPTTQRSQEDLSRPVNVVLSNASKTAPKRPNQDGADEAAARQAAARSNSQYQSKDSKRIRMSEEFDEDIDMIESQPTQPTQSNIKGPPVRPSAAFKKELPTSKPAFPNSYSNAPPASATRDLFKATVTAQHTSHAKAAHPLDTAQFSKGAIPFAPNPNAAGQPHKTPGRPAAAAGAKSAAKSAAKSSPRFPNGDAIELPEIQTDDEDDDDDANIGIAPWADSPDLRRALMRQETIDPMQIFGPPAPLNMEEVFSKSKDRWHKFRNRTSSANWSGSDRLTEDDVRKDLAAREKLRREGAWTYGLMEEK